MEYVSCTLNIKPLDCKWVYSLKLNYDVSLNRYKTQLVALDKKQEH